MSETDDRYDNLLDALAGFVLSDGHPGGPHLAGFMHGYAGAEWEAAVERARARRKKALLRQMQPEFWSD